MAIDSIGPKMMIQSATEVAKDTSAIQKHGEMMQNSATQQVQSDAERMTDQVIDLNEAEEAIIQRERERERQQRRKRRRRGDAMQEEEGPDGQPPVGMVEQKKIDIRI